MRTHKITLIICFLLFHFLSDAQDAKKLEDLKKQLVLAKTDTAKARILNTIGWEFRNSKPDSGIYYALQAISVAEKINATKYIATSKSNLAKFYYNKSDDATSVKYCNEALSLYTQLKDSLGLSSIHMYLGYSYNRMNRTAEMLNEFIISLSLAEKTGNKEKISTALYSLADYYKGSGDYKQAETYLLQSLAIDKDLNNKSFIASDYQYLGLCYTHLQRFKESENYLLIAIKMYKELNDNFHLGIAYSYLANLYNEQKEYGKSVKNYILAQQLMKGVGAKIEIADLADNIAKNLIKLEDYTLAEEYAKQGLEVAEEIHADIQTLYLSNTLGEIYASRHDFEKAFSYSSKVPALMDSIYGRQQQAKLLEMQAKFETEKKEKENQLLKAENETAQATIERNRAWLLATAISLLLLALLTFVIFRNRKAKIKNIKKLQSLNTKLEQQKQEISEINSTLELRALRTQMNPHFIFNCMNSIQECILLGNVDDATKYLSKLSQLMRMVLGYAEQENIFLDKELEMLELYLQLEFVRLKKNFHYEINIDKTILTEEIKVPSLILQPFVENAIWHGLLRKDGTRILKIQITENNNWLQCVVEDNGIGRKAAGMLKQPLKHYESKGIAIVTARLSILNRLYNKDAAGFEITDLYDTENFPLGTKIILNLPII